MPGQKQQVVTKQGLQPAVLFHWLPAFYLDHNFVEFSVHLQFNYEKLGFGRRFSKDPIIFSFARNFQVWFGWPRRLFRNSTMCG